MDRVAERVVILRLNQTRITNKFFERVPDTPIPIWFIGGQAKQLIKSVSAGDAVSISCELRVQDDSVHVHALDIEKFGSVA